MFFYEFFMIFNFLINFKLLAIFNIKDLIIIIYFLTMITTINIVEFNFNQMLYFTDRFLTNAQIKHFIKFLIIFIAFNIIVIVVLD